MPIPVSLAAVADELESVSNDIYAYIDRETGELVTLSNEDLVIAETGYDAEEYPEWQLAILASAEKVVTSSTFVRLPTSRDIHEWAIMEEFCRSLPGTRQRRALLNQIRGSGAFRKFKDALIRYDLEQEWFAFYKAALTRIAKEFLETEAIPYTTP
ncbi:MAG TPA: UPF0158 family protein [Caldilineaceae bacterium]|nr:UPF0158 family protein [Caldilineaceae bacterium]